MALRRCRLRKLIFIIILSVCLPAQAWSAVALDNKIKAVSGVLGSTLSTGSITVTGSNLIGVAYVATFTGGGTHEPTGVTWNGVAMTKDPNAIAAQDTAGNWWYIIGPTTGVIQATWAGNETDRFILAASYTGAKQSAQPDASSTRGSSNEPAGTTVTSAVTTTVANCMVVAGVIVTGTNIPTSSPHTTELSDGTLIGVAIADNIQAAAGTNTVTWTIAAGWQFLSDKMGSFSIAPAVTAVQTAGFFAE